MLGSVIAVPHPAFFSLGLIKEINLSGIVLEYKSKTNNWRPLQKIDLIWSDYLTTYHLKGLPVRTVSDIAIDTPENENNLTVRQQTICFENLAMQQKKELERLIKEKGSIQ